MTALEKWNSLNPLVRQLLLFAGLFGLAILYYFPTISGGFVLDDWWWAANFKARGIMGNDHAGSGPGGVGLFYRPVVSIVYGLWATCFGLRPIAFHVLSLSLVAFCALGLQNSIGLLTGRRRVALLAGVIFVLWPSHAEPVCWVAGLTDMIATSFSVAALWILLGAKGNWRKCVAGLVAVAAALFSKESAVVMPFLLPLFLWFHWFQDGTAKDGLKYVEFRRVCLGLFGITSIYLIVRSAKLGSVVAGYDGSPLAGIRDHLLDWRGAIFQANLYAPMLKAVAIDQEIEVMRRLTFGFLAVSILALALSFAKAKQAQKSTRLHSLIALFVLSAIVSILPALYLPVGFDGQQSRFAFLGSLFSISALCLGTELMVPPIRIYGQLGVFLLGVSGWDYHIGAWSRAGEVSRQTTEAIQQLGHPRRIYVLTAPGTLDGAYLFLGGLETVPTVLGMTSSEIRIATIAIEASSSNRLRANQFGPLSYALAMGVSNRSSWSEGCSLAPAIRDVKYFRIDPIPQAAVISPLGFQPGDRIMVITTDGVRVLK